jgi:hydroxymethylpyrimidine pyrophosphatase-like HAD family hydrolase
MAVQESRKWDRAIVAHITDGILVYEGKHPNFKYIDESDDLFVRVDDLLAPEIRKNSLQVTILNDEEDEFNDHITGVIKDSGKIRRAGPFFLNIFGNKAGKLSGVKEILKETGIKKEELMVIGDSELDLGIIKYAAVGVAMGDATPIVKEGADYVTADNNSSGVAEAINKYILSDKC